MNPFDVNAVCDPKLYCKDCICFKCKYSCFDENCIECHGAIVTCKGFKKKIINNLVN